MSLPPRVRRRTYPLDTSTQQGLVSTLPEFLRWNPNMLVPWYLLLSLLYYRHDVSLVPDALYDHVCRELLERLDVVEHPHKYLVSREALGAGTGHHIAEYPTMVEGAAFRLARQCEGVLQLVAKNQPPRVRRRRG